MAASHTLEHLPSGLVFKLTLSIFPPLLCKFLINPDWEIFQ